MLLFHRARIPQWLGLDPTSTLPIDFEMTAWTSRGSKLFIDPNFLGKISYAELVQFFRFWGELGFLPLRETINWKPNGEGFGDASTNRGAAICQLDTLRAIQRSNAAPRLDNFRSEPEAMRTWACLESEFSFSNSVFTEEKTSHSSISTTR